MHRADTSLTTYPLLNTPKSFTEPSISVLQQWVVAMNTETSRITARKRRPTDACPRIRRHMLLVAKFDRGESNTESDAVDVANFARQVLGESSF